MIFWSGAPNLKTKTLGISPMMQAFIAKYGDELDQALPGQFAGNPDADGHSNAGQQMHVLNTLGSWCLSLFGIKSRKYLTEQIEQQRQEIEKLQSIIHREQALMSIKGSLTSAVAHEFGTPLSAIRMKTSILSKYLDKLSTENIVLKLQQIDSEVNRMIGSLDDLLFINRVYGSQGDLRFEPFDLEVFCKFLLEQIREQFVETNITFSCSGETTNATLDRHLVRYILSNLISNAVKYSPSGGEVRLEVHCAAREVVFTVIDHGIGIPEEDVDLILTPFFRARNAGDITGMGLGLSIVKTCVEMYDGSIQIMSKLGEGTTFRVSLPYSD